VQKSVLFIHGAGGGAYAADRALANSLQHALGTAYHVEYPQMPDEENAPYLEWAAEIDSRLRAATSAVALVGHSVGGSVLLKYLCDRKPERRIAGLFAIATPYWGADKFWRWEEVTLPENAASKLACHGPLFLYHSRDDEVVPFTHLGLYEARFPTATIRALDGRGHQFNDDLAVVGADLRDNAKFEE
jgi:uncharacterized protein